ncbi:hypothetical protein Cch01nite_10190 [Cellulomonas chitinilytica]|uniref:DUF881 domain-containing protein n=1 Tax=Cellulomonas chitinilytica TaxID=398759 RepID=A0A919P131_9CELL|nr:DUF881 domain-containing protein [Cellulomonas chitinilytica]GIG20295.1 hypothetical protein Cch01nite_10190 [Cellulomonas chitinilytica]
MSTRHSAESSRPLDASMTLLNEVYRRPLDPGYAQAAARRSQQPSRPSRRSATGLLVLAMVLGLAVTTATLSLRRPAGSVVAARHLLEQQIVQRGDEAADLQEQVEQLSAEIARMQDEVLRAEEPGLGAQLASDAVASGAVPVSGPGLRVVLTDGPIEDPDVVDSPSRVRDGDLQVLVNGLWAAGAEAVAVNGERITSTTAIRSAGDAVLVDLVALASPYTVDAIGDAPGMQTAIAQASAGQHLAMLRNSYNIGVRMSSEHKLTLPGTGQTTFYYATVPPEHAPTVSPRPSATDDGGPATGSAPTGSGVEGSAGRSGRDGT